MNKYCYYLLIKWDQIRQIYLDIQIELFRQLYFTFFYGIHKCDLSPYHVDKIFFTKDLLRFYDIFIKDYFFFFYLPFSF